MRLASFVTLCFFTLALIAPSNSIAHSGGLNKDGCHNDNINGGYHCHNGGDSSGGDSGGDTTAVVIGAVAVTGILLYLIFRASEKNNLSSTGDDNGENSNLSFSLTPTVDNQLYGAVFKTDYKF